jgi:hypothetical protein
MSTNPAWTFDPAVYASYWHALRIYLIGPLLGMLAAAEYPGRGPGMAQKQEREVCLPLHSSDHHELLVEKS